jgi:hypothetical protein
MGMNASRQLVMKWGDAEGLACMAGSRNKLTVIDIDARGTEGERLLADVQRTSAKHASLSEPAAAASMRTIAMAVKAGRSAWTREGRSICSAAARLCCHLREVQRPSTKLFVAPSTI